jgi:predicted outer membrane repeat protein
MKKKITKFYYGLLIISIVMISVTNCMGVNISKDENNISFNGKITEMNNKIFPTHSFSNMRISNENIDIKNDQKTKEIENIIERVTTNETFNETNNNSIFINPSNGTIKKCLDEGYTDIYLASGSYSGGNKNTGLTIKNNVTIHGENGVIIDGENNNRIFSINPDVHLNLLSVSLINGNSDKGGLIYCVDNASMDLVTCSLSNSKSTYGGGGIYLNNNNNPSNIKNCNFTNNNVDAYNGGAIFNSNSKLNIENSIFKNNHAYFGGTIYNSLFGAKTTNIKNSIFESNNCGANGGAIFNMGGSGLTVSGSMFKSNYVNPVIGSNGEGGAIYNNGSKNFNIESTNFNENNATRGACIYNDDNGEINLLSSNLVNNVAGAGTIYNKGSFYITDASNINNNTATSKYGGAIVNKDFIKITISNIDNNKCNGTGGAIYSTTGNIIIADSELNNNVADDTGGAITAINTTINLMTVDFKNNIAGTGGAIHANSCQLIFNSSRRGGNSFVQNIANLYHGGALFLMGETSGFINDTVFKNNNASFNGGAIFYGQDMKCINKTDNSTGYVVSLDNIQYLNNVAKKGPNVYSSKYGDRGNIGNN